MSLVQYYPGKTFVHKLDPRSKLIALVLSTIVIFASTDFKIIGLIFCGSLLLWSLAKLPASILLSYMKFLGPLLILLILSQALFYPGNVYLVKPLIPEWVPILGGLGKIDKEGVIFGFVLSFRLITLITLMPLVTFTTPVEKFTLGLIKLGLPYTIAYTATTALNMIPILQNELGVIMDAQKLRAFQTFEEGKLVDKVKAYPTLVIPLIVGSMRSAQQMGVAMDSKAFGTNKNRTFLDDITFQTRDWVFLSGILLLTVAGIIVSQLARW
ncbi:MAG TPA: energy-coupling factor transporter transmembrane protein EcfT [Clostridia bacterium]|nr:energy-coupling factor transporter transmembrane protein EcfT [Clostridia bacterium]